MIRRSHKKSRQGCAECKRGHKKCDETRPACVNCTTTRKQCSYTRTASPSPNDREFIIFNGTIELAGTRTSHLATPSHTTNSSPRPRTPTPPRSEDYVNILHLELFQNVTSNAFSLFDVDLDGTRDEWMATMLRYTFSYQYLMYEVLALSAFHLSIKHPSRSGIYLAESTVLQAKALSLFNSSAPTVNQDNILPAFLFSGTIGLHFFCDTFSTPIADLNHFLDRLVQSIRLLRGVRALIGDSWEMIKNSDIRSILSPEVSPVDRDDEITHAFEGLRTKFSTSHTLSAFDSKVYCEAITDLIWVYCSNPLDSTSNGRLHSRTVTTWPIRISAEFTRLLDERKPEALVVIAYFSILLHSIKEFWAVGDAGKLLLAAIEEYLGEGWAEWFVVPKRIVLATPLQARPYPSILI